MWREVEEESLVAASRRMLHCCLLKGRRDGEEGQVVVVGLVYEAEAEVLTSHHQSHSYPYRAVGKDYG